MTVLAHDEDHFPLSILSSPFFSIFFLFPGFQVVVVHNNGGLQVTMMRTCGVCLGENVKPPITIMCFLSNFYILCWPKS